VIEKGAQFDVLLADFAMPGMNGADLAEIIRGDRPDLPVIFMTGYQHEGRFAGERWVLTKPFASATLEKALAEALRQLGKPALSPASP
jgi:CheY-like chemotaxis protein